MRLEYVKRLLCGLEKRAAKTALTIQQKLFNCLLFLTSSLLFYPCHSDPELQNKGIRGKLRFENSLYTIFIEHTLGVNVKKIVQIGEGAAKILTLYFGRICFCLNYCSVVVLFGGHF